ncbi:unnamed protein product [Discosporangium mesarthrocarpum]
MTWLNDEVINTFMKLLDARDQQLCGASPGRRRSHFFTSFFLTKLKGTGYNYQGVKRWTKKVKVFELDKVYVPVNVNNMHWCMAVIYIQQKRIQYYDSMMGTGEPTLKSLLSWLGDETKHKLEKKFNMEEWELVQTSSSTPQQQNGSDCGAFSCAFAWYISEGLPLSFSQEDIPNMRNRMLWSLLNQRID